LIETLIDEGSQSTKADVNGSDDSSNVDNGLLSCIKPFVCQFTNCGRNYSQKSSLNAHIRSHTDVPFMCFDCGKPFSRKLAMERHLSAHSGEKLFHCGMCSKSFSRKDGLSSHVKRIHCVQIKGVECELLPIISDESEVIANNTDSTSTTTTTITPNLSEISDEKYASEPHDSGRLITTNNDSKAIDNMIEATSQA
jgi:hypothetical protein